MSRAHTKLDADYAVFQRNRTLWARDHNGEYALIHDKKLAGFYPDYESALRSGLKQFGVQSDFLVKQVSLEDPVFVIY